MARIPEAEVQQLKEQVAVQSLVEAAGIELKKTGKDLAGKCPWHADGTPSLVVTPSKNLWHCFSCQVGGGPIDWVMKLKGVSFRHAVELLKEDAALVAVQGGAVKHTTVRALSAPVTLDADDRALLAQVVDYYHQTLKTSSEAQAYLQSRGLAHPELIEHFKLGYANRTLGLRLPAGNRKSGGELRARLARVGVYRDTGREHLNGCLVVPVIDEHGQVTELYGRKTGKVKEGEPKHLYLAKNPARGRGAFNVQAFKEHKEVILCEALIDALTFWGAGYRNVTSAYGIEGDEEVLAAFQAHGTQRVLIAYDRDEPGERAAAKLVRQLQALGIECLRIHFPRGMDANEYACKVTPAAKSLGLLIRQASWLGKGAPPVAAGPAPVQAPGPRVHDAPLPVATQTAAAQADSTRATAQIASETPAPASPVASQPPGAQADEIVLTFADRRWRIRGLAKCLAPETLKVNVLASRENGADGAYHVDAFDLYAARARGAFITSAARELAVREDVIKHDLGRVLLKLEELQAQRIAAAVKVEPQAPAMSQAERAEALAWLKSPDLMARILADFDAVGLVGEASNKLMGYLAATSRKLDAPLAVVVQSSSAAGKSSLMDAVLAFMPEEERIKYSAMTGQSLFYMGETNLKHKILAIAEEEGANRAAYALKLLQSEGELTIASTGKDPTTGNLVTQQYRVQGPVMIFLTTTAIEIDEELLNRCIVLSVDEGRAQTEAIHARQRARRTLAGLRAKTDKRSILAVHRNAQRLLRPLAVVNPWAERLTFLSDKTRTRRDHEKYLTLIDTIALLHQHQRPVKTLGGAEGGLEYIEVQASDIAAANALAHELLGASLHELPPVTRRLLGEIVRLVQARMREQQLPRADIRFSRKHVRDASGMSDTQLRVHLERLVALEYLLTHRGARGQSFEYELLYDGDGSAQPHLSGLLEIEAGEPGADAPTNASSRGDEVHNAGPTRPQRAPDAGTSPSAQSAASPHAITVSDKSQASAAGSHVCGADVPDAPYAQPSSAAGLNAKPTAP